MGQLNFKQIEILLLRRLSDLEFAATGKIFITKSPTSCVVNGMKHAYVMKILSDANENCKIYGGVL